jgi:hypothetical protein
LTPHTTNPSDQAVSACIASEAGAPEVTPAMVEAGVAALCASNEDFEDRGDIAEKVFLAMWLARF